MDEAQRFAQLEELVWVLSGRGGSPGVPLNRQPSVNGDPDSGQFVAYAQSYIPQGTFTLINAGITVTPSNAADQILFELLRGGVTFGSATATRVGTIVGADLSFIDGTRPATVLTNYTIRATNLSSGHSVSLLAGQAYLNMTDFL